MKVDATWLGGRYDQSIQTKGNWVFLNTNSGSFDFFGTPKGKRTTSELYTLKYHTIICKNMF